jgi:hypothetical protein
MIWLDIALSIVLPFAMFGVFALGMSWLAQRTPVSSRAMARAQEMGPPPPRVAIVDEAGNARHEWAVDLEVQRLRQSERRW